MSARTVAVRVYRAATTTEKPPSPRTVAVTRWIGRFCSVILLAAALLAAANSTWQGELVALYAFTTGVWCWRHQAAMRGA